MIGVILWSDPAAEKAVVWCEDHGDLAFLSRDDCTVLPDSFFDVGDMVKFDLITDRSVRRVKSATRLPQNCGTTLNESLSLPSEPQRARVDVSDSAEVIPFRLTPAKRKMPAFVENRRRRG